MRSAKCEVQHNQYPERKRWAFVAWALLATLPVACGREKVVDPPGGPPSIILEVQQFEVSGKPAPERLELTAENGGLTLAAAVPSCGPSIPWQANAAAEGELLRVYLFQRCGDLEPAARARLDCFIAGEPAARARRVELFIFNEAKGGFATLSREGGT